MSFGEITLILLLCVLFLNPNEIKVLFKNASNIILNINKYINSTKEHIIKLIDTDKNNHK